MSVSIKGKQIAWGIPAGVLTAAAGLMTAVGIVESFELDPGGSTTILTDEDDDPVTRIDHNAENKFTMGVVCTAATVKPAKGAEIVGSTLGTIDGINFTTGRTFVDSAKVVYNKGGEKKLTIAATHYPTMGADA